MIKKKKVKKQFKIEFYLSTNILFLQFTIIYVLLYSTIKPNYEKSNSHVNIITSIGISNLYDTLYQSYIIYSMGPDPEVVVVNYSRNAEALSDHTII